MINTCYRCILLSITTIYLLFSSSLIQASGLEIPKVNSTRFTDSIFMISGKGGNLGVSMGEDGTFLIDDQYPNMTKAILAEIESKGGSLPKFVINTHYHGDHSGGNINLGKAGSIIVAHNNVRKRLSKGSFNRFFNLKTPPQPKSALPIITFENELTFHLNGDDIEVRHIANAHTDGDSVILFHNNNVLHTGDLFFNGFYPFIDTDHGGSLKGMAEAASVLLTMVNDETQIIPGHGPMARRSDLLVYRDMLNEVHQRLSKLKKSGMSVNEVIANKPLKDMENRWGKGFLSTNKWIKIVYSNL